MSSERRVWTLSGYAGERRGKPLCVAENPQCRLCLEASSEQLMARLLCVALGWLSLLAAGAGRAAAHPFILQHIRLIFIYLSALLRSPIRRKSQPVDFRCFTYPSSVGFARQSCILIFPIFLADA